MTYPTGNTQGVPSDYFNNPVFHPDLRYEGGGWTSYSPNGTKYSYAELEALWLAAGGPPGAASNMAAIAEQIESGGYNGAWNDTGATGLWQIEYPGSSPQGMTREQLFEPLNNAKAAVALYERDGYSPWGSDINNITVENIPPAAGWPAPVGLTGATGGTNPHGSTWLVNVATGTVKHVTNGTVATAMELAGWKAFFTKAEAEKYAHESLIERVIGYGTSPAEPFVKATHLSGSANFFHDAGTFFHDAGEIFKGDFWKKVGKFILAALLVGFGLWLIFGGRGDTNVSIADKVEKSAKTVGTVAAVAAV